ncbi:GAF domain-containing protein, partial [bacterium]|nr:GAF domain-containing protein [bacterium]
MKTRNYLIPLPLILIAVIFITDTIIGAAGVIIKEIMLLREIAFLLLGWFIYPTISRIKLFKTKNIISLTRNLFIFLLAGLFTHVLATWLLADEAVRFSIILKPFTGFIVGSILSLVQLILVLAALTVSRDIIYLRRRKSTQRNFNLFRFAMLGFILYRIYVYYRGSVEISNGIGLDSVFSGILVFFIVVNSFRNSWINYLTKNQKLRYLLLSLFLAIIPSIIYQQFFTESPPYSIFIYYLQLSIGIFIIIYWSLAFTSLLFHLPTAGIVDRKMKEIHSLHTLSQTFSSEFDFNRLVIKITELSTEVTEANGAWLEILHADTGRLELIASKNVPKPAIKWIDAHPESNVGQHVLQLRDAVWINDARKNDKIAALKKRGLNVGSLMAVPILSHDKILGVLYIFKALEYDFIPDDLNMLKTFADQ